MADDIDYDLATGQAFTAAHALQIKNRANASPQKTTLGAMIATIISEGGAPLTSLTNAVVSLYPVTAAGGDKLSAALAAMTEENRNALLLNLGGALLDPGSEATPGAVLFETGDPNVFGRLELTPALLAELTPDVAAEEVAMKKADGSAFEGLTLVPDTPADPGVILTDPTNTTDTIYPSSYNGVIEPFDATSLIVGGELLIDLNEHPHLNWYVTITAALDVTMAELPAGTALGCPITLLVIAGDTSQPVVTFSDDDVEITPSTVLPGAVLAAQTGASVKYYLDPRATDYVILANAVPAPAAT